MENPAFEKNNNDVMKINGISNGNVDSKPAAKSEEDDLWALPELKSDEKTWQGMV